MIFQLHLGALTIIESFDKLIYQRNILGNFKTSIGAIAHQTPTLLPSAYEILTNVQS